MKNKGLFLGAVALLAMAALASDEGFLITITAPPNGATLILHGTATIQWTHSPDFVTVPQTCDIYCGSDVISPEIPVTNDQFVWTVGKKKDGTFLSPGTYEITIESPDYDALNGPFITLAYLTINPDIIKKKFPIFRIPDCPMCFKIDPRLFLFDMKGLEAIDVRLFRAGREVVPLGRFSSGKTPTAPVQFKLGQREFEAIQKSVNAWEVRALSLKGELLLKQPIQVEFK